MAEPPDPTQVAIDELTTLAATLLGNASTTAAATTYQTLAHATTLASYNAVFAQQQAFIAHQAATDRGVAMLLSLMDK